MRTRVFAALAVGMLALLVLAGVYWFFLRSPELEAGILLDSHDSVAELSLLNTEGERTPFAAWQGEYLLVFFGYTNCPDVCPTTMGDLARAREELGPLAERVRVVMVTVDPERDTPERLDAYMSAFDPSFTGLTGSVEEITRVAEAFGAFFEREESESAAGYLMAHSSHVTLVDPRGEIRAIFPFGTRGDVLAADLRKVLQ